jgi:glucokinase
VTTIGIDVGGTKVLGVALDDAGALLADYRSPTPAGGAALVEAAALVVEAIGGVTDTRPAGVGVGVAGLVSRSGVLVHGPNLGNTRNLELAGELRDRLPGLPVMVDNDATCAAAGEQAAGAARGAAEVVVITLGTGIGGGVVTGGRVLRGAHGFGGEIGHMIVDPGGPACPCGRHGCWERYASGSGLGRLARDAAHAGQAPTLVEMAGGDPELVRGEHVTTAATSGDEGALAVMASFAWWLALGLSNLAEALDPEVFVLTGGMIEAGEVLLEPTREAFRRLALVGTRRPPVRIVGAALGERAAAVGAAVLAREALAGGAPSVSTALH